MTEAYACSYPLNDKLCKEAQAWVDEISKDLPVQMTKTMIWESAVFLSNNIYLNVVLKYDRDTLIQIYEKSGMDIEDAKQIQKKIC